MAWAFLIFAGLAEIVMTTSMRYIDWSLKPWPIALFLISTNLSFGALIVASWTIPLGTAYAIWVGIGAAGTAIVGIWYYGEPATTLRLLFLTMLIASIAGLKLVSPD
jgi:quaternary ammonium compound-resistance protein SugE